MISRETRARLKALRHALKQAPADGMTASDLRAALGDKHHKSQVYRGLDYLIEHKDVAVVSAPIPGIRYNARYALTELGRLSP